MLKPTKTQKCSAKKCYEKPHQIWIPAGGGAFYGKTKLLSLYRIGLGVNGEVSTTAESFTIYLSLEFAERRGILVVKIMKWW